MKQNEFIRQAIVGGVGVIVSIVAAILVFGVWQPEETVLVLTAIALLSGLFLGSFLSIFAGLSGFLTGSLGIGSVIAVMALITALPHPWKGYAVVAVILAILALPFIWNFWRERRQEPSERPQKRGVPSVTPADKEEPSYIIDEDESAMRESLEYGRYCLLVADARGRFYQLIKDGTHLLLHRCGGELLGLQEERLLHREQELPEADKDDLVWALADITRVTCPPNAHSPYPARVVIRRGKRSNGLNLLIPSSADEVASFFAFAPFTDRTQSPPPPPAVSVDQRHVRRLKDIVFSLTLLGGLTALAWLFLDVPYRLMAWVSLAIPPILLGLYIAYPSIVTFRDPDKQTRKKKTANIMFALWIPGAGLTLRSLLDFNLLSYSNLILFGLLLAAVLSFLFFLTTDEYTRDKEVVGFFVIFLLSYVPAAVIQLNYLLDFSPVETYQAVIIEKTLSQGSKAPDIYTFTVKLADGTSCNLKVSEKTYANQQTGDGVTVKKKSGFLGIPYARVITEDGA